MDLSFNFNGADSSAYGIIGSPKIPLLPARRRNTMEVPGMDGEYDFANNSYGPLLLPLDCTLKAGSRALRKTGLASAAAWLMGSGALILGRDTSKQWANAKLYEQIDLRHFGPNSRFELLFECNPPWLEDVEDGAGAVDAATDYASPLTFLPTITVEKTGDPATTLQISLLSTGEYMLVTDAIISGDTLVFNMSTGKVTKNGVSVQDKLLIGSSPFGVPTGTQTITVTTQSTYTASLTYKKRYVYA
jgi:phage-related protein